MNDIKELIKDYLAQMRIMQLATSADNKPRVCNVHFYADADFNFYWISKPDTQHSLEIEENANAAITIKIHEDTPEEKYVIGLSAQGEARKANEKEVEKIGPKYVEKLEKNATLLTEIQNGTSPFAFYKFTPSNFVLFDTKNFPDSPRQEHIA